MTYQGIKIFDKVIIVEKTEITSGGYNWRGRTVNQGYVVDPNSKDGLENAKKWARWKDTGDATLREKSDKLWYQYWEDKKAESRELASKAKAEWEKTVNTIEGVVHEYDNGQFEIVLDEAAGGSSQSGKLSFWNCVIKAPDGNRFLIGINSELLLHLLMSNTFVNGVCQNKVWLGRVRGSQVGAFTENMEEFSQSKIDESMRKASRTSKYKPGDVVSNLKETNIYLGPIYHTLDFYPSTGGRDKIHIWSNYTPPRLIVHSKAQVKHFFASLKEDGSISLWCYPDLKSTKPSRIIEKHIELEGSTMYYFDKVREMQKTKLYTDSDRYVYYFGSEKEAEENEEDLIKYFERKHCDLVLYTERAE